MLLKSTLLWQFLRSCVYLKMVKLQNYNECVTHISSFHPAHGLWTWHTGVCPSLCQNSETWPWSASCGYCKGTNSNQLSEGPSPDSETKQPALAELLPPQQQPALPILLPAVRRGLRAGCAHGCFALAPGGDPCHASTSL